MFFFVFILCIYGNSFHPFLNNLLTFELSTKNNDTFDDKNKLISICIFFSNLITCYLNIIIFFTIFSIKAKKELEEKEKNFKIDKKNKNHF